MKKSKKLHLQSYSSEGKQIWMINNSLIGENNILIAGPKLRVSLYCAIPSILMFLMGKLF